MSYIDFNIGLVLNVQFLAQSKFPRSKGKTRDVAAHGSLEATVCVVLQVPAGIRLRTRVLCWVWDWD